MASQSRTFDVAAFLDDRRLSRFNVKLILLSWLITVFDGLDMMMVSYTAPYMKDELGLSKTMLGNIFASGTAGMVVGGILFSYVGDRIGRRPTVITTAFAFGLLTIATAFAHSYEQLLTLRFLDGLAIGGMLPLAWALNIEFVPRSMRSTVVAVIMMGYSLGSAVAGPLTNFIAPSHGWQGVYLFGGFATLVSATVLAIGLPESVRFLVHKGNRGQQIVSTLQRLDPAAALPLPDDHFILGDEVAAKAKPRLQDLFAGHLKLLTPLLWMGYVASSLAIYLMSNWSPTVLEELHFSRETAALIASSSGLLGAFAGMALMRLNDRHGLWLVAAVPAIAVPVLLLVGMGLAPWSIFIPLVFLQTILIGGSHASMISISSIFYPSAIRASGGGWVSSIGKIGGVMGPIIGAAILSSGLPVLRIYAVLAICPAVLALCMWGVAYLTRHPAPASRSLQEPVAAE